MTIDQTYTRDQAMERLGIKSTNAFKHFVKKYSDAFVIVNHVSYKFPRYNKAAIDRFAQIRDSLKNNFH